VRNDTGQSQRILILLKSFKRRVLANCKEINDLNVGAARSPNFKT
jgi:hypothetical protein